MSQYIDDIVKAIVRIRSQDIEAIIDDDLRGNAAMNVERIGHYDGLTSVYKVLKQTYKTCEEPNGTNLALWLYGNEHGPTWRDRSEMGKIVTRVGFPCVVRSAGNGFPATELVTKFDGIQDGGDMADHDHYKIQSNTTNGLSLATWLYPINDAPVKGANPYAIKTNGTTDILTIPNRTAINNFTDFTISFWFYPITNNPSSTPNLVIKNYSANNSFILYYTANSFLLNFRTINNTAVSVGTTTPPALTPNKWYHICLRFTQASGLMELIVNLGDPALGGWTKTAINQGCVNIGTTADLKFDGNVSVKCQSIYDEIRIFRRAITDEELTLVYNGIDISGTPAANTEVHHAFTEGSGTTSVDEYSVSTITIAGTWVDPKTYLNPDNSEGHYTPRRFQEFYSKRDDANNHLIAYLNSVDKSIGIQLERGGTLSYKKTAGDANVLWFDGVNDYISCGAQTDLWGNTSKTEFSFSIWVNPFINGDGVNFRDFVINGWGSNYSFDLYFSSSSNAVAVEIAGVWPARIGAANSSLATNMGSWYHITVTYKSGNSSGNRLKIYVNAVRGTTTTDNGGTVAGNYNLTVAGAGSPDLKGYAKDFRWWNREISQTEVSAVYAGTDDDTMKPDYWLKLDEGTGTTVNDCIGNKTATLTNGPVWRDRPENQVIDFDGVNDYIDCGSQATLWSQSLTKFSFSVWIYLEDVATAKRAIIDHGNNAAQSFLMFRDSTNLDRIAFRVVNAAAGQLTAIATAPTVGMTGRWVHCVGVYDNSLGSANVKVYQDGVLGGTTANLTEAINLAVTLKINVDAGSGGPSDCKMKDFRWWTTKALTAAEVTKLFNGTDTYDMKPDYWLPLDEGTGNPKDAIGGSLTATLTNGAAWVELEDKKAPLTIFNRLHLPAQYYSAYQVGKWSYIVVAWNPTGDVFTVYSKGRLMPTITTATKMLEPTDALGHLMWSGSITGTPSAVYSNIAFRNLKWWLKQLTKVEVNNEQRNKFTISNLNTGEIGMIDRSVTVA